MGDIQFLKELQENVRKGQQYKYLYFWGHTQKVQDLIDKTVLVSGFLQNLRLKVCNIKIQNSI